MSELNPLSEREIGLTSAATGTQATSQSSDVVNEAEFLNLLVTQLQNQDPLDPMKNEEFAVQLAQFSQVEELIKINENLEGSAPGGAMTSLASYLGQEVWLDSDTVNVQGGEAGEIAFNLPQDAASVTIELVDSTGAVLDTVDAGALRAGDQKVNLSGITGATGNLQARVVAQGAGGAEFNPEVSVVGLVSGYVPGPSPTLLVGDQEVDTADIRRVQLPTSS